MKADELKQYIINNDNAYIILEDLGFHKLKDNGEYITMAVPNFNNPNGMSMLKENLFCNSFTTNFSFKGYLFDLVSEVKKYDNFGDTMRYIHRLLNLKYEYSPNKEDKPRDSILDFFKKYDRKNKVNKGCELKTYTEKEVFQNASKITPYLPWIKDGILPNIQEIFSVHYNYDYKRVCIVWRNWKDGEIVGVTGRTTKTSLECEMFDIPKYMSVFKFKKSENLFGLYENKKYILDSNEIIMVESEKAVMQLASKGVRNAVAVGCHSISEEQVKIIIGLDVSNVVIAFDKDVTEDIIKSECVKFKGMRNVYYIYDSLDLLGEKESPTDKHYKVWQVLYKRKFKYKE